MIGPRMFARPHHDGSELYVSNPSPDIGDTVDVFVRVPRSYPLSAVHVRSTPDAEPSFAAASVDRSTDTETWWRASVRIANPDTRYRFLLDRGPYGYSWLNATGTYERDISDDRDFRLTTFGGAPSWAADSVIYQIFPDRFASSGQQRELPPWAIDADWYEDPVAGHGPLVERQVYGGDLPGIEANLDHVAALGANVVYLTPFFAARSNHRYNATDFTQVDPLLGGNDALGSLAQAVHDRKMRLIGDLTTNHTGDQHRWFLAGRQDRTSEEAGYYYWHNEPPGYLSWLGVPSLPKLNWASDALWRRMISDEDSIVARWLRPPYGLDGWRIDVANMTARHASADRNQDVARAIRTAMSGARSDSLLIAEHGHDFTRDLSGDGWHGSMNYAAFTRPIWRWLVNPELVMGFLGVPVSIRSASAIDVVATMTDFLGAVPWQVRLANMNLLGSHDTARIRTVTGDPHMVEVGAVLLFTLPGIPTVFAGDEIGLTGRNGEDARRPFPWKQPERWDNTTFEVYQKLIRLRRSTAALQRGGLRWVHVGADLMVFLRETARERVLVAVSRADGAPVTLPPDLLTPDGRVETLYGADPQIDRRGIHIPGHGPAAHVWRLG